MSIPPNRDIKRTCLSSKIIYERVLAKFLSQYTIANFVAKQIPDALNNGMGGDLQALVCLSRNEQLPGRVSMNC